MRSAGRRARYAGAASALVGLLALCALAVASPAGAADGGGRPAPTRITEPDSELQAAIVAKEDRRLDQVRTVVAVAQFQGQSWKTPYRLATAAGYTLVLTPRSAPYTVDDLLQLAPRTFVRMSDGSFLLEEHIIVMPRATLHLSAPKGLTLRLASSPDGFATIVAAGGQIQLAGEEGAPVKVTSWNTTKGAVDDVTTDGRAYIRAIGGQFDANYAELTALGFWSGRTGGLALTGTDRPDTGAITPTGSGLQGESSLLDGVTLQPADASSPPTTSPDLGYTVPAQDYVSVRLQHVVVDHDAFGLFVSGANGLQVTDSKFTDNLLGGVVLHRAVTSAAITNTVSSRNVGDGFTIDRASTGINVSSSTANDNSGSGFRLSGRPLADGPSAVGSSLESFGNNSVSGSTASGNGQYGIELIGGVNIGVQNSTVSNQNMGIVVKGPAKKISIVGNTVRDSDEHAVTLADGVTGSTVTGNVLERSSTGIYLRDSVGVVKANSVLDASSHGVSLVGQVGGSRIASNRLTGNGPSALDTSRGDGDFATSGNDTTGWSDTTPWTSWFKKLLEPMNALWALLAALLVVTAVRGRRRRKVVAQPVLAPGHRAGRASAAARARDRPDRGGRRRRGHPDRAGPSRGRGALADEAG